MKTRNLMGAGLVMVSLVGFGALVGVGLAQRGSPSPPRSSIPIPEPGSPSVYRAFSAKSYWNTPLPRQVPIDPRSGQFIQALESSSQFDYIRLAGTDASGRWGMPIYWATPSDPTYHVTNSCGLAMPHAFNGVRIPRGARPSSTEDANLIVYDRARGAVYALQHAAYDGATDSWSSCGGTVYWLGSNGLEGTLPQSNDRANFGHRGAPPPTYAIRWAEIRAGTIHHVLRLSVNGTCGHVFPMTGDEGCDRGMPPEGTRLRIDPTVDLSRLGLSGPALVIARALQSYGAVITDRSDGPMIIGVEDTVTEGLGWLWRGVLDASSLQRIPLRDFQVVRLGYAG
jgi:hypothetical protein